MTIREFIIEHEIDYSITRADKLEELGAPEIMVTTLREEVERLKAGKLKIGGATEKLDNEAGAYEVKTGRGGKQYIEFEDGTRYFPNAKYGRYIA